MTETDAERALREAHETLVKIQANHLPAAGGEIIYCRTWGDGHTAIDAAVRAAFEAGQRHSDDSFNATADLPLPPWLPGERRACGCGHSGNILIICERHRETKR